MLLEELAEDLVSATSGLLDGRIINIMNPDGIIIASTQPERIGTFHKGARDAAVSGKPVSIRPDQIQEYSGAREGYNMPLRVGGNIIGVVGIYGEPSEIRYLAHLVEVYTEKYYQLEALIRPQYAQGAEKHSAFQASGGQRKEHRGGRDPDQVPEPYPALPRPGGSAGGQ